MKNNTNNKKLSENQENVSEAEETKDWTDIHEDFGKNKYQIGDTITVSSLTLQQSWEEYGLTYQDAKEWTKEGFKLNSYYEVNQWKKCGFTPQEAKFWKETDLGSTLMINFDRAELAAYLRSKGYQPNQNLNWKQLREEFEAWFKQSKPTKEWLDVVYPQEQRNTIKKLDLFAKNLMGTLDCSDFVNLEELNCSNNNQLTSLKLDNCEKLRKIYCAYNNLNQNLSFLKDLINLERLDIYNNPVYGSLEPLQNLKKLRILYINDTDIDSGLEYLSESIEDFKCSVEKRKDAKVKVIEEEFNRFNQNVKKLREFSDTARQWLDKEYPENGKRQEWGGYMLIMSKKRAETTESDISYEKINKWEKEKSKKIKLKGGLWLKGFASLKKLNCSGHQLTDLDLSGCPNLIELNCSNNNELHNLDFLETLPNPKKLEKLWIQNNLKFTAKNLDFLRPFISLKELNISDCRGLKGSLKSLENAAQLEEVFINHTNISEGLEHLPESCKELNCELDYDYSSVEIAKQLSKFSEGEGKYNLEKWRIDKQNIMLSSIIPLERLFVIRGNIKHFVSRWGVKKVEDGSASWYDKFYKWLAKQAESKTNESSELQPSELSKLQYPNDLWKHRWTIYGTQFVGRGSAVAGAILTFRDEGAIGGGILGIYPFTELLVSKLEESLKDKENKWKEFLADADTFLDNYNELLGILAPIEVENLKEEGISKELKNLDEKVKELLKIYDQEKDGKKDGEIDIKELTDEKHELAKDLNEGEKSKVQGIIDSIKALEEVIVKYRKSSYRWISEKETGSGSKTEGDLSTELKNDSEDKQIKDNEHHIVELGIKEDPQEQSSTQAQIEFPPKNQ